MEFIVSRYRFKISYPLLLLILVIIALWQLAFFQNGLQWDIIDAMLPWRYFAGECFQNGTFPLWDPYQAFGFPMHADIQYMNWAPEAWLIGNLGGYSLYTLYFLIIFYTWLSGVGMYKLAGFFCKNNATAFLIAACYMLSGCVIAHLQQFNMMIAITWLPFVCWQFFELMYSLKWKNVFGLSLFIFLLATGHLSISILLLYFLLAVFVYRIIEIYKQENRKTFLLFSLKCICLLLFLVVMLAPIFVALAQSGPYVARLKEGVPLEEAGGGPFSPQSMLSFFLPVTTVTAIDFFNTDITCSNLFFGFIPFSIFLSALFQKQSPLQRIILFFALIYLLASFGNYLPVRNFMHQYVPLFNFFKGAGQIRILFLLLVLIMLSIFLNAENRNKIQTRNIFTIGTFIYFVSSLIFFFIACRNGFFFSNGEFSTAYDYFHSAPAAELIFFESFAFFVISLSGLLYCSKAKNVKHFRAIGIITVLSLIVGMQFNIYFNIASENPPSYVQEWMQKELPKGIPLLPENPSADYSMYAKAAGGLYRNTGNFFREPIHDEFTSYRFDAEERLNCAYPEIKKQLTFYPVAYLSDSIYRIPLFCPFKCEEKYNRKVTFLMTPDSIQIPGNLSVSESDTIFCEKFFPDEMVFNARVSGNAIFNLQQACYPGWEVTDNGKPSDIIKNAGLCMSVLLHKGKHNLKFHYTNNFFISIYWTSFICFVACFLIFLILQSRKWKWLFVASVLSLFVLTIWNFQTPETRDRLVGPPAIKDLLPSINVDKGNCIIEDHYANGSDRIVYDQYGIIFRSDNTNDRKKICEKIKNASGNKFCYAWRGQQPDEQISQYIRHYFPKKEEEIRDEKNNNGLAVFSNELPAADFENVYEYGDTNSAGRWMDFYTTKIKDEKNPGRYIIRINRNDPYSPAFVGDAAALFKYSIKALRFSFRIKSPGYTKQSAWAVFSLNEKIKETIIYSAAPYFIDENSWNFVCFRIKAGIKIKPGMKVKIFIENSSFQSIEVKDLRVETLLE